MNEPYIDRSHTLKIPLQLGTIKIVQRGFSGGQVILMKISVGK